MSSPRLALVHEYFCNLGGADAVAHVLHEMFPDAPVYTLLVYDRNRSHAWLRGMDLRPSFIQRLPLAGRTHQLYLPLMPSAIEQFDFSRYDLVLSSSSMIAKGILPPPNVPHISYTHTRQRVAWDLESEYINAVPRPLRIFARAYMHRLRRWDVSAAQRVDHFVANSHFVAARLNALYHRDSVVIPPPTDLNVFAPLPVPRGDYYVAVGRLVKYKCFDMAIEACAQLKQPLRIIGDGPERAALQKIAGDNIQFLGTLSHAQIRAQLAGAKGLLFGGIEDFGLAAVEAQAVGCPVIAYAEGGTGETVIDGETGVLFHEPSVASMVDAIRRASQIHLNPQRMREHVQQFSLEQFKFKMNNLIEQVAGQAK